ncbi:hypothetical protein F2Q68_00030175 [Brassica cretica]|uniref:Uncharacterized protein n=1 Tax=Brassica cretica TaxID=69181 RepID=A0A8S9GBV8_BRACR|nr:hypothetical protein F2Q68_00030175 [Brassica cretica]
MIGLHGKSNLASTPQQDKRRKKQNRYDDEKWVRSGDYPFTKTKRSSRDVTEQNEIQTYASLEKMLHKEIHALISTKVRSSDRTDQTDRAVPRTSRLKLRQEPRPDDRIPRTGACLSYTVLHSKINGQDITEFERVDFKIDGATSSLASSDCTGSRTGPVVSLRSWYIKSHSASLDDPFIPFQFQKCHRLLGSYQTPGQNHPSRFGRINIAAVVTGFLIVSVCSSIVDVRSDEKLLKQQYHWNMFCDGECERDGKNYFCSSNSHIRGMKVVVDSDMTDKLLMRQLLKFDGMRQKGKLEYTERHMALFFNQQRWISRLH